MKVKLIRTLKIVAGFTALATLGWGSYTVVNYLRTALRFEVKALSVTAVGKPLKRMTQDEIIAQAEFEVGTNVFRADLEAIRKKVEALQWVRFAIVQRVLPSQIIIRVVERTPIGLARIGVDTWQFDEDAAILPVDTISDASFPILDGLRRGDDEGNLKKVEVYRKVLAELGETELSEVHLNDAGEVTVVSASDPLVVNLGTSDFRMRWIKYLQLKTQIQQQYPQAVKVDLRFKNQVIVKMRDDAADKVVWEGEKRTL